MLRLLRDFVSRNDVHKSFGETRVSAYLLLKDVKAELVQLTPTVNSGDIILNQPGVIFEITFYWVFSCLWPSLVSPNQSYRTYQKPLLLSVDDSVGKYLLLRPIVHRLGREQAAQPRYLEYITPRSG